jgi:ABC-type amino acid transport substrate-binding protein
MTSSTESRRGPAGARRRTPSWRGAWAAAAVAALAALAAGEAFAQDGLDLSREYTFAVDEAYPPFSYTNDQGALTGFDAEIARALCEEIGIRCRVLGMPFDDILPAVVAGTVDAGVSGFGWTAERAEVVDFTDKYYRSTTMFIQRGDSISDTSPAAIKGKRIGVQKNTIQETYARETFVPDSEVLVFDDNDSLLAAMSAGQCDLGMVDGLAGFSLLKSEAGEGFDVAGDPLPLETESRIAVPKRLPAMTAAINAAIPRIRQSGVYDEINRRYFSFSVY